MILISHCHCDIILISHWSVVSAIMITGGQDKEGNPLRSVEVFAPRFKIACWMPAMNRSRAGHTVNDMDGGYYSIKNTKLGRGSFSL